MPGKKSAQEVLEKIKNQTYARQAKYRKRKRQSGQVRVSVWVPQHRADELRRIAQAMCLEKPKAQKDPFGAPVIPVTGKTPGWSYLTAERDEVILHTILKAHGATWQNAKKKHPNTWRIRSDLVKDLGLEKRVVAEESAGPKPTKKAQASHARTMAKPGLVSRKKATSKKTAPDRTKKKK